ncbi:hypothetical protein PPERSA_09109 [Pseudocohnilembus persalinus]|uniref:Uncharacterized protein n=1 Tax=Pseudocohnilembus persalinus TaxID=266149 RepID=A0A0V0QWC1_PSEPJ|nr:hypothetical protein PPERSA_09109 [Pseudocohnilembus persalinus]|eukprot:KRX06707.1 hypothetical protein PPERSA_09109 [Pseudocohnilembus persalinus]
MAQFFTGFSYPYIFSICGQALSSSSIVALYLLPKNVIQDPVSSFPVVETTGPRAVAYVLGTLGISWQFLPGLEYLDTGDILINGALTFSYWKISQLIAMNFRYKNLPATNVFLSGMIVTLFFTSQAKIIPWVLVSSLFCSTIKDDFYQANPDYLFYSLLCMIVVINIYNQQFFQVIEWTKQEEVENQMIENQENNEQQILKQNELKEQEKVIENGKNKENQKQQYEEENSKTKQTNKNQLNNTKPPSKKSDS